VNTITVFRCSWVLDHRALWVLALGTPMTL
jgi:hypothetical protein